MTLRGEKGARALAGVLIDTGGRVNLSPGKYEQAEPAKAPLAVGMPAPGSPGLKPGPRWGHLKPARPKHVP